MGNIIVGHGQDGDLGNRTLGGIDDTGTLIERSQVGIQIARVALTTGDLALGRGELTQRFTVGSDVGHEPQQNR